MNPSFDTVKDAVLALWTSTVPAARIYAYRRFIKDVAQATTLLKGTDGRLHFWFLTDGSPADTSVLTAGTIIQRCYHFEAWGFMALQDASATARLMSAECSTLLTMLLSETGRKLPGVSGVICQGMTEDGGLSVAEAGEIEYGTEGGTLCHYRKIPIHVRVQIAL